MNSNSKTPEQYSLDLGIEIEKDIGGIEMGVLQNGIPYLTQRGIANISGAARATIFEITQEWEDKFNDPILDKGRNSFFKDYLFKNGYKENRLFIEISRNGSPYYAYPDVVCMAFIEYFAFESQYANQIAMENYRRLARLGLEKFIYNALNYSPEDKWKYFNDRVSILQDSAPPEHFTLFSETTGLAVDLINASLVVNDKTLPDISVGLAWGKYWNDNKLSKTFGERIKYSHNFPSYYPQAASNPQSPWAYPDAALPLFRKWFRNEYLPTKFPKYILSKADSLKGGKTEAAQIASLYENKKTLK
ncbi:hypothetical protein [Thalassospira sp. TSL5-1]|uniref:hypothetical protein n=1 Tax=Thalassospira sp. TSL5-1 TaxID=1544451 RepID=UPI00093E3CEF|nr:hypothetical protein [Thalassospira sp. TSL5-1]OKH87711.1 hypothetical protein LF95_13235 [Thalassospira sp. TSL5-1]